MMLAMAACAHQALRVGLCRGPFQEAFDHGTRLDIVAFVAPRHEESMDSTANMRSGGVMFQGHRIKIGGLGRMANSAFGGKLNLCGTCSHLFTMFVVYLVVNNKYNVYVR